MFSRDHGRGRRNAPAPHSARVGKKHEGWTRAKRGRNAAGTRGRRGQNATVRPPLTSAGRRDATEPQGPCGERETGGEKRRGRGKGGGNHKRRVTLRAVSGDRETRGRSRGNLRIRERNAAGSAGAERGVHCGAETKETCAKSVLKLPQTAGTCAKSVLKQPQTAGTGGKSVLKQPQTAGDVGHGRPPRDHGGAATPDPVRHHGPVLQRQHEEGPGLERSGRGAGSRPGRL